MIFSYTAFGGMGFAGGAGFKILLVGGGSFIQSGDSQLIATQGLDGGLLPSDPFEIAVQGLLDVIVSGGNVFSIQSVGGQITFGGSALVTFTSRRRFGGRMAYRRPGQKQELQPLQSLPHHWLYKVKPTNFGHLSFGGNAIYNFVPHILSLQEWADKQIDPDDYWSGDEQELVVVTKTYSYTGSSLPRASLPHASLSCASLLGAGLPPRTSLARASLPHAGLSRVNLSCASLPRAGLPHASLPRASLPRASLPRASLPRASLPRAKF